MVENFSLLSLEEREQFATELVAKLNATKVFSDEYELKVFDIDADEMDGSLGIVIGIDAASIDRDAFWQCGSSDEASDKPSDFEFTNTNSEDAKKAFKTLATEFEGYSLELKELDIDDCTVESVFEVYKVEDTDSGIGHYEWFGFTGYDSHPYCEVEGSLDTTCNISAWLVVTAK